MWKIFHCAEAQHLNNQSLKWVENTRLLIGALDPATLKDKDFAPFVKDMKTLLDVNTKAFGQASKFRKEQEQVM